MRKELESFKVKSSQNTLLVDIDVGKTKHCTCFMASSGKLLRQKLLFTNTIDVSKDKSDPKDAYNVADLIYQGKFYLPIYRDREIRQLKRQGLGDKSPNSLRHSSLPARGGTFRQFSEK